MLTVGRNIYIFHYSRNVPFYFTILYKKEIDNLVVQCIKKADVVSFVSHDPIVVCIPENEDITLYNCDVTNVDLINNVYEIKVDLTDTKKWEEKRKFERNPVSLYADIRIKSSSKRNSVLIKNISYSGMLIYSKTEIPSDEEFELDLYADKKVFFLKAKVVRTLNQDNYFEHGLQVVYSNYAAMEAMKQYVLTLKESQKNIVRTLEVIRVKV